MIKFYLIILIELLLFPILFVWNLAKRLLSRFVSVKKDKVRNTIPIDNEIIYAVHEWAGYPPVREKMIRYVNKTFICGLKFQLQRIKLYQGKYKLRPIITVSGANEKYLTDLKQSEDICSNTEIIPVENYAMDFSGYSYICHHILDINKEQVVFLTNSSVNNSISPFIDEYVQLFKTFPNLGLVGVSCSSMIYQSLVKNNFNPHLQSFFLVSKTSVIKKVLKINNNLLPGEKENYKLSIIRFGEVRLTKLVQKLGYDVALVSENGELVFFPDNNIFNSGYYDWKLPHGDYRLYHQFPNQINKLKNESH